MRNLDDPQYETARKMIEGRQDWIVDLLYGDEDGGQRVVGRFRCQPTPWAPPGAHGVMEGLPLSRGWLPARITPSAC